MDLYPLVFRIVREKEASVANYMVTTRDQIVWNINFMRTAQDREIGSFENFLSSYIP